MARRKNSQLYAAVRCECGRIHFLGFAAAFSDKVPWYSKPQRVQCDVTGKYKTYQPDEIFVTPKGPK